jgi:transposase
MIGLDLAKNIFHLVGVDAEGREIWKKALKRSQMPPFFANLPCCVVGIEACAGAHEWGRQLQALGHEVRLLPPQRVKAYVQGNKNDFNDARAIAEAMGRPRIRPVALKTRAQQDLQALYPVPAARGAGGRAHRAVQPAARVAGGVRGGRAQRGGGVAPPPAGAAGGRGERIEPAVPTAPGSGLPAVA